MDADNKHFMNKLYFQILLSQDFDQTFNPIVLFFQKMQIHESSPWLKTLADLAEKQPKDALSFLDETQPFASIVRGLDANRGPPKIYKQMLTELSRIIVLCGKRIYDESDSNYSEEEEAVPVQPPAKPRRGQRAKRRKILDDDEEIEQSSQGSIWHEYTRNNVVAAVGSNGRIWYYLVNQDETKGILLEPCGKDLLEVCSKNQVPLEQIVPIDVNVKAAVFDNGRVMITTEVQEQLEAAFPESAMKEVIEEFLQPGHIVAAVNLSKDPLSRVQPFCLYQMQDQRRGKLLEFKKLEFLNSRALLSYKLTDQIEDVSMEHVLDKKVACREEGNCILIEPKLINQYKQMATQ